VVVGAGAAGLTAAIRAAESGASVTLLNAHPKIGLKILMSGGTRCNVTHREVTPADYFGGSRNVIARILRAFTPEQTRTWFESLGVALKLEETGKYFPVTDDAQTVLDALLRECARVGVEIRAGARVTHIDVEGSRSKAEQSATAPAPNAAGTRFRLGIQRVKDSAAFSGAPAPAPGEFLAADAVILATGGLSFPRTGSDGVGYQLARALGHSIVPTVPALTPLTSEEPWCVMLKGVAFEAELTLRVDGKVEAESRGSLLFTHFGYSGPASLDLSRHWHRAEGRGVIAVTLNSAPGETRESLEKKWLSAASDARLQVRRHLGAWLPDRLVVTLCAEAGVGPSLKLSQVPRERRRELIELLVARPLRIYGTLGYEKAEVTAGGVPLDEVEPSTLESRRCAGLYLCGEILDVEGRLGGFNFQWSWSSGTIAGRAAAIA
jgi:predicted flavoprotein YhiN